MVIVIAVAFGCRFFVCWEQRVREEGILLGCVVIGKNYNELYLLGIISTIDLVG